MEDGDEFRLPTPPTWNGELPDFHDWPEIARQAFDLVLRRSRGEFVPRGKDDQMHVLEASSWVLVLAESVQRHALVATRDMDASWAELGDAIGLGRSTAKSKYNRAIRVAG
jgi:hypothetical protein